ncbi:hypothetical protein ABZR86_02340 [Dyella marensis]|uniref:Uncharacterized protein n=1 Tax=Dyella marensis TaxID=500610 RepID=A0A1I2A2L5_9GAMM|nr:MULTISPECIES: hypothetical protein [Dyella]SFE38192.1 hypothetical protein SAMN02799615_00903 [Dyella marensis]
MAVKKAAKAAKAASKKAGTKKATAKRAVKPRRQTVLHDDGSIQNAVNVIERVFKLPKGSVRLIYPSGVKAHIDSTVGNLRKRWAKHG